MARIFAASGSFCIGWRIFYALLLVVTVLVELLIVTFLVVPIALFQSLLPLREKDAAPRIAKQSGSGAAG